MENENIDTRLILNNDESSSEQSQGHGEEDLKLDRMIDDISHS